MNFSFCKEMESTLFRNSKDEYLIPLTPFSRRFQYDTMSLNMLRSSCFGIPGLDKNVDETRGRRLNNVKNGFLQHSNFPYREDRESFFASGSANEGLGIFITAGVFFATFFFKKKVGPRFLLQSLLFLLLAQKKETKKRALAIEKTPKILLQP